MFVRACGPVCVFVRACVRACVCVCCVTVKRPALPFVRGTWALLKPLLSLLLLLVVVALINQYSSAAPAAGFLGGPRPNTMIEAMMAK